MKGVILFLILFFSFNKSKVFERSYSADLNGDKEIENYTFKKESIYVRNSKSTFQIKTIKSISAFTKDEIELWKINDYDWVKSIRKSNGASFQKDLLSIDPNIKVKGDILIFKGDEGEIVFFYNGYNYCFFYYD